MYGWGRTICVPKLPSEIPGQAPAPFQKREVNCTFILVLVP